MMPSKSCTEASTPIENLCPALVAGFSYAVKVYSWPFADPHHFPKSRRSSGRFQEKQSLSLGDKKGSLLAVHKRSNIVDVSAMVFSIVGDQEKLGKILNSDGIVPSSPGRLPRTIQAVVSAWCSLQCGTISLQRLLKSPRFK